MEVIEVIEVIESRSIVLRIVCLPSQRSPRESNLSDSWVYYFIILLFLLFKGRIPSTVLIVLGCLVYSVLYL